MIWPLKNLSPSIVDINSVGDFAYRRSFYHHPGIDIYCDYGQEVTAIEEGIVVGLKIYQL
jgi:murein DD-endopeptidase MepM/ murein hydrolase activator NlpD